ncbi:MAG: PP2C family serine/threonine-protein phosphatase [Pseudonocardiaceae bacterium]
MAGQSCPQCAEPVGPRDRFCAECGARMADQLRDRVEVDVGVGAGVSDRGRRHHRNEDALALRRLGPGPGAGPGSGQYGAVVAVVCDGVSSADRPDEASETAAEVAAEVLVVALRAGDGPVTAMREAIHAAGRAVAGLAGSTQTRNAPACTLVSAVLTEGTVTVGWVGDSRAYWIPRTRTESAPPTRLTEDDSWLAQVLAAGTLTFAEAATDRRAHSITAWLGEDAARLDPHVVTFTPEGPGVVVVCTDGLWNYLDNADALAAALPAHPPEAPLDAARRLVETALTCGGRDNITAAVLPFGASRPGSTS